MPSQKQVPCAPCPTVYNRAYYYVIKVIICLTFMIKTQQLSCLVQFKPSQNLAGSFKGSPPFYTLVALILYHTDANDSCHCLALLCTMWSQQLDVKLGLNRVTLPS